MIGNLTRSIILGNLVCVCASAQNIPLKEDAIPSDDIRKAIDDFNRLKAGKTPKDNEVTVVLDPPAPKSSAPEGSEPVLVKPAVPAPSADSEAELPPEEAPKVDSSEIEETPETGLEIRVEQLSKGTGDVDAKNVKLETSFPVKLLSSTPENWTIATSDLAPAFTREIEISPGNFISVKIPPHILAADADGSDTFSIAEPGFAAPKGYTQENTVTAILGASITQLDEDSKKLGSVLSELHTLLASLPKPETELEKTSEE